MAESDLIQAIRDDHAEIKSLLARVAEDPDADVFEQLAQKITAHEAAEQAIVHPLASSAPAHGEVVAKARLREEDAGAAELQKLEELGVADPDFPSAFTEFRRAVLTHAEHEEREEHPVIVDLIDADQLRELGVSFRDRERAALNASS